MGEWTLAHRQLWGREGCVPCLTGNGPVLNGHILTTNLTKASVNGKKNPCGDDVFKVRPGPTPRIPGGWAGQAFSLTLNNLKLHFTQQKYWGPRTASLWVSLHVNGSFPKEL